MKSYWSTSKINFVLFALIAISVSACGGGASNGGLPQGTGGSGGPGNVNSNQPASISLTTPDLNAITDLQNGSYQLKMAAVVSDAEGNPVPDGTKVDLFVIDSIKARGTIDATGSGDLISGTTLTDALPLLGGVDNSVPTAPVDIQMGFTTAYIQRATVDSNDNYIWGSYNLIQPGDHVILQNAQNADMVRVVSQVDSATTISVGTAYSTTYPNTTYDGSTALKTVQYFIGDDELGESASGTDANSNSTPGYATTVNGVAQFEVTYPASSAMDTGCTGGYDYRTNPPMDPSKTGGAYIVASVDGNIQVSTAQPFCFAPIAGETFRTTSVTVAADGNPHTVFLQLIDGGNQLGMPYEYFGWSGNTGDVVGAGGTCPPLSAGGACTDDQGNPVTDGLGYAILTVQSSTPGDSITVGSGAATATITFQ